MHEIYSHCIPGFDGKIAVAREANRAWPISLPEKTDVFIANKVINQLRNLLYRKLVEQKDRIQDFYNQMKHDKRRMSHVELSSSGEESDTGDKSDEDLTSNLSKYRKKLRAMIIEDSSS